MVIRSVSVSLGVALLAALPSTNADSGLWREQVRMDASRTIVVTVLAGETVSASTPAYLWRAQLDAARVQLAVSNATAPEYALWREQLASRAARDDATRTAGR
jgi:hypothetical protein